jgi:hypothetical protein
MRKPAGLAVIGGVATLVLALIVVIALVVIALLLTGGRSSVSENAPLIAPLIAAVIALGGVFTTQLVNTALENQRAHEAALQKYLEQVGKLLIKKGPNFSMVARAQTLAVLKSLRGDRDRKRVLMLFLSESELIDKNNIGFLRLADLSDANLRDLHDGILCCKNLSKAHLERADLSNTELRNTDLTGAYLMGADLRDADLTGADLTGADLKGAKITKKQLASAVSKGVGTLSNRL